jgi:hypothetical protein
LESLGDAGTLAEVAWLHLIMSCIPVYSELSKAIQELSEAFHKFQTGFNEKTREIVEQLTSTTGWMEAAKLNSCTHVALADLTQS